MNKEKLWTKDFISVASYQFLSHANILFIDGNDFCICSKQFHSSESHGRLSFQYFCYWGTSGSVYLLVNILKA